eukprot:TCONS_00003636-protein
MMEEHKETESLLQNENVNDDDIEPKGDDYTIEEAIERIGFGKFQLKLLAMVGFAWSADSLEMALLAILAPAVRCEWHLSHYHEAMLTTIVFIGMLIFSYFWGWASDTYGRRKVLIWSTTGVFVFGLVSAFSHTYVMILLLRGGVGASMAGTVQGTTLIVEYLPVAARGLSINVSGIFWSAGTCFEVLSAMYIMPRHGWRVLLFWSAWPCLIFVVATLLSKQPPESVRFLVSKGRQKEAEEILHKAAKENNKEEKLQGNLITLEKEQSEYKHGSFSGLFKRGYWRQTLLLWVMWFASHFNIYGLSLLTTALFSSSYTCYGEPAAKKHETENCKPLTQADYLHFFYVLAADFPAILVTAILTDTVGRKWLQAIGFFVMGIFFTLLLLCTSSRNWTTFFLFGVRCFAAVADVGGYIYTPEVYPTEIRGIALGSCSAISRIGAMLTPFVSQVLTHTNLSLSLSIYIGFSIIGGVCSLLLPIETKGKGLEEINEDLRKLGNDRMEDT